MKSFATAFFFTLALGVTSYQPSPSSRRAFVETAAAGLAFAPFAANAISACSGTANSCIRTTWTLPDNTPMSKQDIAQVVEAILLEYPKQGQSGVDKGGWSVVDDKLASNGKAKVQFRSGTGQIAKLVNNGKPFTDDLDLEITNGKVEIRSSSLVDDVNKKRLKFLANAARAKGWDAPDPKV